MAEKLTPQQQMAVSDRGGRLLVSAAAGSGKTKVLVDRLMSYLMDPVQPANIDEFLMITYTKAAAAELRGKIASKLAEKIAEDPTNRHLQRQQQRLYLAKISTVHAFCGDALREYAYRLDLGGDFRVADEQECAKIRESVMEKVLQEAYAQAADNPDFCTFLDTQGVGRNDKLVPELVEKVYDSARCHLDPEAWLSHCLHQTQTESIRDASQTVYGQFLMERLKNWVSLQMDALENCAKLCKDYEGLEKVHDLLMDTVYQLGELKACSLWDDVVRKSKVDFGKLVFPRKLDDELLKEKIKSVREACKKGLEKRTRPFADPSDRILKDMKNSTDAMRGLIWLVRQFETEYARVKRSLRVLDFGDLEHYTLDLLLGKKRTTITGAAKELGSRFREVMVDEYQDSNAVQDAIYAALTDERKNLFLVGDVKQSIYQFRLADPSIFLRKYQTFASAEMAGQGEDRKVLLSQNFRSSGGVLSGCNDVFSLCMCPEVGGLFYGTEEALYEGIPHLPLEEPELELCCVDVQEHTYPEEAAYVAGRIQELLEGEHYVRGKEGLRRVRPEDIVILLRSPGSAGGYYEKALSDLGIRYTTGGGVDLLKTEEIAAIRACLQAVYNPRLDIPLIAAMASPIFCFKADDLAAIRSGKRTGDFLDAVESCQHHKIPAFLELFRKLRHTAHNETITALLQQLFTETKLESVYGAMANGESRMKNIQAFYQVAADFEMAGNRDLGRFLEHLDGLEVHGMISAGESAAQDCVSIMSIHKSKGLEFPIVFLCGLGREFNMESQRAPILCHKFMGLGLFAVDKNKRIRYPTLAKRAIAAKIGEEMLSEELRVLYVAMTRAKDRLIMTYASNRLEKDLTEMVQRLAAGGKELLIREAVCLGDWVLLTALHKTEAFSLFALGGRPEETASNDHLWKISVVNAPDITACVHQAAEMETMPQDLPDRLSAALAFRYPYMGATAMPSKMTATQKKGRLKDDEAAENTAPKQVIRQWRKPGFAAAQGKDVGNATHTVLQYIQYPACADAETISREIQRLVADKFITQQQAQMVDKRKLAAFFATELGQKLRAGEVVREFKFSILEDATAYDPTLNGEQVLMQGVVDCALIEDDGITIVDFKTDQVTEDTVAQRTDMYRQQVAVYADAMERIYERPIKERLLYFFALDRFVKV